MLSSSTELFQINVFLTDKDQTNEQSSVFLKEAVSFVGKSQHDSVWGNDEWRSSTVLEYFIQYEAPFEGYSFPNPDRDFDSKVLILFFMGGPAAADCFPTELKSSSPWGWRSSFFRVFARQQNACFCKREQGRSLTVQYHHPTPTLFDCWFDSFYLEEWSKCKGDTPSRKFNFVLEIIWTFSDKLRQLAVTISCEFGLQNLFYGGFLQEKPGKDFLTQERAGLGVFYLN